MHVFPVFRPQSMRRPIVGLLALSLAATFIWPPPAFAGEVDPDRRARRMELRQQIEDQRERWRADGQRGADRRFQPQDPGVGRQVGQGDAGGRLSPDERRELRRELRELRR